MLDELNDKEKETIEWALNNLLFTISGAASKNNMIKDIEERNRVSNLIQKIIDKIDESQEFGEDLLDLMIINEEFDEDLMNDYYDELLAEV
jgi:flagellar biosynthesis GTPase FlhF